MEVCRMRKYLALMFTLVCALVFAGCSSNSIDTTKPLFETADISRITFFCVPNHTDGIEVPDEYLDEITTWIGTFTIEKEASEILDPGTNTFSFQIEYKDGAIIESGLNTTTIDGVSYYMKYDTPPECFEALFTN
jgi:hypothetical protein